MIPSTRSIDEMFGEFHRRNPEVYDELVALAREAKSKGRTRIGIKMMWEVLRWNRMLQTTDEAGTWKLNNNYHSRYVRLIKEHEPELGVLFETRTLKAA